MKTATILAIVGGAAALGAGAWYVWRRRTPAGAAAAIAAKPMADFEIAAIRSGLGGKAYAENAAPGSLGAAVAIGAAKPSPSAAAGIDNAVTNLFGGLVSKWAGESAGGAVKSVGASVNQYLGAQAAGKVIGKIRSLF